ncbi:hypothetical protein Bca4012_027617 [Brassica carinata]
MEHILIDLVQFSQVEARSQKDRSIATVRSIDPVPICWSCIGCDIGMKLELPNRLYGEGLEPQVKKINNSYRLGLVELLRTQLKPEFEEVMKDFFFSHIMVMEENNMKFSARLVHSFLCKELMTSKRHEKWFTFARRPLCFGLQEYHAVTSLKVKQEKKRVRLVYLRIIMGVVMMRDEEVNIPHRYMKLVMGLEQFQNYPWSLH